MRTFFMTFFMAWLVFSIGKSQIVGFEYYINSDPGIGKAIPLSVEEGTSVFGSYNIPIDLLEEGFHRLGIRTSDANGIYSLTYIHPFYISGSNASENVLSRVEYFIDTDPGVGGGVEIPLEFDLGGNIRYVVPLSDVSAGLHLLGVRTRNAAGIWSLTQQHFFYNRTDGESVNVVRFEYFFSGEGATDKIYTHEIQEPSPNVELDFTANLSELVPDREYTIHVIAVAEDGKRSREIIQSIKACSTEPAKADFDLITLGTKVSFIDSTKNTTKYLWDFGDGRIDSVSNPIHEYTTGGNYQVRLIASNFCNTDTITKTLNVLSLESIFPKSGGNSGYVTVNILGGGFNEGSIVKLKRGGESIEGIIGAIVENGRSIQVSFDLGGKEIGDWTVEVSNDGSPLELGERFQIEQPIQPVIHAEFVGRNLVRAGRQENLTVRYSNTGNVDALMVPITLQYPSSVKVELFDTLRLIDNIAEIVGMPDFQQDTISHTNVYGDTTYFPLIIPIIPANGSGEIEFIYSAESAAEFNISIVTRAPLLDNNSFEIPNGRLQEDGDCDATYLGLGLGMAGIVTNFIKEEGLACLSGFIVGKYQMDYDIYMWRLKHSDDYLMLAKSYFSTVGNVFANAASCVASTSGSTAAKLIGGVAKGYGYAIGMWDSFSLGKQIGENPQCFQSIKTLATNTVRVVAAFDPNEKVGPTNITEDNYNQGRFPYTYTVYFENLDSATAAAQEVIILDTLDRNTLDLSTFQLVGYGYAKENYKIPQGLSSYSNINPIQRTIGDPMDVRFDARMDTASGVVRWRFLSIDPITRELIDDPIDGFLPPNKNKGEGEGYVTFSIQPKQDLSTGTRIKNKALIYFDFNEPIITNTFVNTIDKIDPESRVLGLPTATTDTLFNVTWSGEDADSGIRSYDILVSVNDGPYGLWLHDTPLTSYEFIGTVDSVYRFYSIAKDYAGNKEADKTQFEAFTKVELDLSLISITGIEITDLKCFESEDGIVIINADGGDRVLEYSLDNESFQEANNFDGLKAGEYTVYVRDKSNPAILAQRSFTISSPDELLLTIQNVVSTECPLDESGSFRVIAQGGIGPYTYKLSNQASYQSSNEFSGLKSGQYIVIVKDGNGCEQSQELEIQAISEAPSIPTVSIQGIDGISKEVNLQSSSLNGNQWIRNGEEILGAIGQTLEITQPGNYQVKVTNEFGCSAVSEAITITNLEEVRKGNTIKLIPNPAEEYVTLKFEKEFFLQTINIVNAQGVSIKTIEIQNMVDEVTLQISALSSGSYILIVEGIGMNERLKMIKK